MSYNGSGTFVINTAGQPVVSGTVISSTAFNALTADLATGLSTAITKDGQTTPTANIPMGNNKITGLAVGTAAADAANLSQAQSTASKLITVSGTDTVTGTLSPTLAAYAAGQMFYWVAAGTNTGAVTLNIDSLGAKAVTRDGSTALAAGDIRSGEVVVVVYDGTRFQVVSQINSAGDATFANVSITSALNVGGVATFTSNPVLSGGTANGVLYLNGSKVATSGSALTFDGTDVRMPNGGSVLLGASASGASILLINGTAAAQRLVLGTSGTDAVINATRTSGTSPNLIFQHEGTEGMRLTSTGLGIGTSSPAAKLQVSNGSDSDNGNFTGLVIGGTNATNARTASLIKNTSSPYDLIIRSQNATVATTGSLIFQNGSTEYMRLDSSGNLGLGVTPSAWTLFKVLQTTGASFAGYSASGNNQALIVNNAFYDGAWKYVNTDYANYYRQYQGKHEWHNAASGTAGNTITFTQAMTLNADGQFLVGATAAVSARGEIRLGGNASGSLFCMGRSGTNKLNIGVDSSDNVDIENTANTPIKIYTNSTERGRFTAGGYFKASNDGTYDASTGAYHEFNQSDPNTPSLLLRNKASSITGGVGGLQVVYSSASPNGTTATFLYCSDSSVLRASIRSNGGLANYQSNNVDLSDARTKKDIAPAASMWGKIGALEIVTYKYNDQTHDDVNVGVIAQQVESVEPVWVDADGFGETPEGEEPLKTVYTKDITFAAIKALQEAMARIEQLEAKVAVLESK